MVEEIGTFDNPSKESGPLVRWLWPGTDVRKTVLAKELADIEGKGFSGAEISLSMEGLPSNIAKEDQDRYYRCHRFLHRHYYEMLASVLEEAKKRNMMIDISLSSGFPAGGSHVEASQSLQTLFYGQKIIKGSRYFSGSVSEEKNSVLSFHGGIENHVKEELLHFSGGDYKLKYVTATLMVEKAGLKKLFGSERFNIDPYSCIELTKQVDEKGFLEWDVPEGNWLLFSFYRGNSFMKPLMSALDEPDKDINVLNHLSESAVTSFFNKHISRGYSYFGEHFGRSLRCVSINSLKYLPAEIWTDDFPEEFLRRRGYDLIPFLPLIIYSAGDGETSGDINQRISYDYKLTVIELLNERFIKNLTFLGTKIRAKTSIKMQESALDIAEACKGAHITVAASSLSGEKDDELIIDSVVSLGISHRKRIISSEIKPLKENDKFSDFLGWKYRADSLFAKGVNQLIIDAYSYKAAKNGFWSENCYRMGLGIDNLFQGFVSDLNRYIRRCQHILQQSDIYFKVAVFNNFPFTDNDNKEKKFSDNILKAFKGHGINQRNSSHEKLSDRLKAGGYYYTCIDEETLLKSFAENGKLNFGFSDIQVVIFNNVEYISLKLAKKLKSLSEDGVKFLFIGSLPERQPGFFDHEKNDLLVKNLLREINEIQKAFISGDDVISFLKVKGIVPQIVHSDGNNISFIQRKTDDAHFFFILNNKDEFIREQVFFPGFFNTPHILCPWTGALGEASEYMKANEGTFVGIEIPPLAALIVEFKNIFKPGDHVIKGDLPVSREGKKLVAFSEKEGEHSFTFKNGGVKKFKTGNLSAAMLNIKEWSFTLKHRDGRSAGEEDNSYTLKMDSLKDWRRISGLENIHEYAVYGSKFFIKDSLLKEDNIKLVLSLGKVGDAAVVTINGFTLKPLLFEPYLTDVTPYVQSGDNILQINVFPPSEYVCALRKNFKAKGVKSANFRNLSRVGLLGPVTIYAMEKITIM